MLTAKCFQAKNMNKGVFKRHEISYEKRLETVSFYKDIGISYRAIAKIVDRSRSPAFAVFK